MKILFDQIKEYKTHLINEEKSRATTEKYVRDIEAFYEWLSGEILRRNWRLNTRRSL